MQWALFAPIHHPGGEGPECSTPLHSRLRPHKTQRGTFCINRMVLIQSTGLIANPD
nr:hypothetical protein Q903MT_gene2252 [Picea sitchensis]